MSKEPVFLSYRPEDAHLVEPLKQALRARGAAVSEGRGLRTPGKEATIAAASLFIACFSTHGHAEDELQMALAQLQALERSKSWLVVVRLTETCEIPFVQIAKNVTLGDLVVDGSQVLSRVGRADPRGETRGQAKAKDIQAPHAILTGVRGTSTAIARQGRLDASAEAENVTGDVTALVAGVVLTDGQDDER